MATDDAGTTTFCHLQLDRNRPFAEIGGGRTHQPLLIGTVDAVADPTGAPLLLVDMELVEVAIAITELGLRRAGVKGQPLGVTAKTEGVTLLTVRRIKTLRKSGIQEGLVCRAMGIMAGNAFAIGDRLVL